MGPGRKLCLDPNGRNTNEVVVKDLSDFLPEIYTYLPPWIGTLVSALAFLRQVCLPSLLISFFFPSRKETYILIYSPHPLREGGGGGGVNPSFLIRILHVCRTASKNWGFFCQICYNSCFNPYRTKNH